MANFTHWKETFLDALFPPICGFCRRYLPEHRGGGICDQCLASFPLPDAFTCPQCRGRIPFGNNKLPAVATLCHPGAGYLLLACSFYDHPVAQSLIQQLKFERRTAIANALGEVAVRALTAASIGHNSLLVPIPLSPRRLRERGFNQAALIAKAITLQGAAPYSEQILRRVKSTVAQTGLKDWRQRADNLTQAFQVMDDSTLPGQLLVLVDDVWTSGATMNDAVRALREKGAGRIIGLVLSRIR